MYSYLHFLALLICVHILCGAALESNDTECAEFDKPDWKIDSLQSLPLDAWPWDCLQSRFSNDTLRELASQSGIDINAAAHNGWIGFVQLYAQKTDFPGGVNVSELLKEAVVSGHLQMVKYLVEEKRLPVNESDYNLTLAAAISGNLALIKYLIEEKKVTTSTYADNNNTPVHFTAINGKIDIEALRYFVETLHIPFDTKNAKNDTPALLAAWAGNIGALRYLIERGANIDVRGKNNRTLLHEAAVLGSIEVSRYLVEEKNVSVDPTDASGWTPAFFAASHDDVPELNYLIEKGANMYHTTETINNQTMLHVAAAKGALRTTKYLIEERNMSVEVMDSYYRTPLHTAARNGHLALVQYLISERNAYKFDTDFFGLNLLHSAVVGRNVLVLKYLVDHVGMSQHLEDRDEGLGLTVTMQAAKYGSVPILKYLLEEKRTNKTALDVLGENLLHTAALEFEFETVRYLIEQQGFNAKDKTAKGETAYDLVNSSKFNVPSRKRVLDYLKYKGEH